MYGRSIEKGEISARWVEEERLPVLWEEAEAERQLVQ
jgi:hypothetical protein